MAVKGALDGEAYRREAMKLRSGTSGNYIGLTKFILRRKASSLIDPISERSFADEIESWLLDEDRPGRFTMLTTSVAHTFEYTIWISDPNVAFEFKLRWV
jgi:hypothetical protein